MSIYKTLSSTNFIFDGRHGQSDSKVLQEGIRLLNLLRLHPIEWPDSADLVQLQIEHGRTIDDATVQTIPTERLGESPGVLINGRYDEGNQWLCKAVAYRITSEGTVIQRIRTTTVPKRHAFDNGLHSQYKRLNETIVQARSSETAAVGVPDYQI